MPYPTACWVLRSSVPHMRYDFLVAMGPMEGAEPSRERRVCLEPPRG